MAPPPIDVDGSDDEDEIDEEQLTEYEEMIDQLGAFPVSVDCVQRGKESRAKVPQHDPKQNISFWNLYCCESGQSED